MRTSLTFDSASTEEVRDLIVAHRHATTTVPGNASHGIMPRVAVEGPYCWRLVTEMLTVPQLTVFLDRAARTLAISALESALAAS